MKCACNCPVGQVNAKVARANALWTLVLALLFIFVAKWVVWILLVDFAIKALISPKASPISQINGRVLKWLQVEPKFIFAPPKVFASRVGLAFSIIIAVLMLADKILAANIFAGILGIFAFLEFAFEFCMGCWVYYLFNTVKNDVKAE